MELSLSPSGTTTVVEIGDAELGEVIPTLNDVIHCYLRSRLGWTGSLPTARVRLRIEIPTVDVSDRLVRVDSGPIPAPGYSDGSGDAPGGST